MNSPTDFARALLLKAQDDRYVLERLDDDPKAPEWVLGFHAQQSVEKALKSVLLSREIVFPRTHNLAMLIALLQQNGFVVPACAQDLPKLIPYGVAMRYEDALGDDMPPLDRVWALRLVDETIAWAGDMISS